MKAREIQSCPGCGEHPTRRKNVFFYVVAVDQAIVDARAVQQTMGVAMQLGGAYELAEVLSPDPEVAKTLGSHDGGAITRMHVCAECYAAKPLSDLVWNQLEREA